MEKNYNYQNSTPCLEYSKTNKYNSKVCISCMLKLTIIVNANSLTGDKNTIQAEWVFICIIIIIVIYNYYLIYIYLHIQ